MQIVYRANIRKLIADLIGTLLLGSIIGGLVNVGSKYLIKEAKESGKFSDATIATMFSIGVDSWVYAVDDFNFIKSIGKPLIDWNPFAFSTMANTAQSAWNVITGDKSAY